MLGLNPYPDGCPRDPCDATSIRSSPHVFPETDEGDDLLVFDDHEDVFRLIRNSELE